MTSIVVLGSTRGERNATEQAGTYEITLLERA